MAPQTDTARQEKAQQLENCSDEEVTNQTAELMMYDP